MPLRRFEAQAVLAAMAFGRDHEYVTPDFTPHRWVLEAMKAAYQDGKEEGYKDGYADALRDTGSPDYEIDLRD